ncbi:MAG: DUF2512 family protein [Halanaerobiaceae bacterium]
MKTGMAMILKYVLTFVAALIAFSILLENDVSWVLLLSLVAAVLNYLIGDLFILPSLGNLVASVGDGIMAALVAYVFDVLVPEFLISAAALVWFAVLIAIGEFFFHEYIRRQEEVAP